MSNKDIIKYFYEVVVSENHFVKIFYNVFVAHCTSPSSNSYFPNCSTYWNLLNYYQQSISLTNQTKFLTSS